MKCKNTTCPHFRSDKCQIVELEPHDSCARTECLYNVSGGCARYGFRNLTVPELCNEFEPACKTVLRQRMSEVVNCK